MNRRQKIIVSVTGIFLVLLLLVGLTYAYFLTKINGNENTKSISVTTANLALVYGDGNGTITGTNILPGTTLNKKTFTVKNEGNETTDYVVVIEDVKVTYASTVEVNGETHTAGSETTFKSNDFVYTLTCTSGCNGVNTETTLPINGGIIVGNRIEVGVTQTYELIVTYKDTGLDQSNDMNKSLEAKVNIADISTINPYSSDTSSLAYNIINNAIALTNEERTNRYADLVSSPNTAVAQEISAEDESVLSPTQDDLGTSYYYRGSIANNYINFNGMCWRIVRIEGDGSIKIVLEDQNTTCNNSSYTGNWNIGYGDYGYTYDYVTNSSGTASSTMKYVADYLNSLNSTDSMKYQFDAWLTSASIDTSKLKKDEWCLGNTTDPYDSSSGTLLSSSVNDLMYNSTSFYYDALRRLEGVGTTAYATLRCDGSNYETYESYIGALTADEAVFAGGQATNGNIDYYLINEYQKQIENSWLTLSPAGFDSRYDYVFYVVDYGVVDYSATEVDVLRCLRPAITLLSGTQFNSGDGSISDPYTIK